GHADGPPPTMGTGRSGSVTLLAALGRLTLLPADLLLRCLDGGPARGLLRRSVRRALAPGRGAGLRLRVPDLVVGDPLALDVDDLAAENRRHGLDARLRDAGARGSVGPRVAVVDAVPDGVPAPAGDAVLGARGRRDRVVLYLGVDDVVLGPVGVHGRVRPV